MTWQTGIPPGSWDDQLFAHDSPFVQSSHWAAFQTALGRQVYFASGADWQCLAYVERSRFNTRVYAPYGPVVQSKKGLREALVALEELARQQNAVFVRVEPTGKVSARDLAGLGLRKNTRNIQPQFTWVKDISGDEEQIMADMSTTARRFYRKGIKQGVTVRVSHEPADIQLFLDMIHSVANRSGMHPHPDNYFVKMAETLMPRGAAALYIAELEGKPISTVLTFDTPVTRSYAHAGAPDSARAISPGQLLVTSMLIDSHNAGQKYFDFYGIAPPDQPHHPWTGFTQFKKSFGGELKEYLGTYEKPIKPLTYHLYNTARALRRTLPR